MPDGRDTRPATPDPASDGSASSGRRSALGLLVALFGAVWAAAAAAVAGSFIGSPLRSRGESDEILIGDLSTFGSTFKAVRVRRSVEDGWYRRAEQRLLFVRTQPGGTPLVLSGTCTHLACTVNWDETDGIFKCPCHDGRFGPDGAVLEGPPPASLPQVSAEVRGTELYVRL
jgi:menaquinol-cytochrome c reductase iron-sulfur subunit